MCTYIHIYIFIQLSVYGHLGCLAKYPGVSFAESYGSSIVNFLRNLHLFSIVTRPICIPNLGLNSPSSCILDSAS